MSQPTYWIDVSGLFDYVRVNPRLSGIQRVEYQVCQALWFDDGGSGRIRFLCKGDRRNEFRVTTWDEIAALRARLTGEGAGSAGAGHGGGMGGVSILRRIARRLVGRLSLKRRRELRAILQHPVGALRGLAASFWPFGPKRAPNGRGNRNYGAIVRPSISDQLMSLVKPNDWLLSLGSPWEHPDYAGLIQYHKERLALRFAFLSFDMIPIMVPEWYPRGPAELFRNWFDTVLPLADTVMTISHATARDLAHYAKTSGVQIAGPIHPIPLGSGLDDKHDASGPRTDRLPAPGSYILFVSTIEARKNHMLAFRVWRRLLNDLPRDAVPTLVFAGRTGWLVADLMRQLRNCHFLNGKIVLLDSVTDTELTHLYRGCLFTLFPSFYEGWGLPVAESLAFGKPCLAANNSAIPEAGGALARYFDADSVSDAYAKIRATIEDPLGLAAWTKSVEERFEPVSWSATAHAVMACLDDRG